MATANTRRNKNAHINDLYVTPYWATHELLLREKFEGTILEPACGLGHITKAIKHDTDNKVISTDLYNYGYGLPGRNFLERTRRTNNIVTNPPYTLGLEFAQKAIEITQRKIAFFTRVNFLETPDRKEFFKMFPPKIVYLFSERVNCPEAGKGNITGGAVFYCWIIWDKQSKHNYTKLEWI